MVWWALLRPLLPSAPAEEACAGGQAGPPISITHVRLQQPIRSGDTDRRRSVALWAPGGQTMPEWGPRASAPTCMPGSHQPSTESKLKDFHQLQQIPSHLD